MAGSVLERKLTTTRSSGVEFHVASQSDDADIRRLLRENPMAGRISLTLEREPNYFADAEVEGETKQTIVARNAGRAVCVGQCTIRQCFINGTARRVGYLGGLRLDAQFAGRFDIVRRGYEFFRELQMGQAADFYFTSIATDNQPARRLLEANIRGLPTYEYVGELVTLIISTTATPRRSSTTTEVSSALSDSSSIAKWLLFLNSSNAGFQFSPCWNASDISAFEPLGLKFPDFRILTKDAEIMAGATLWDQRSFKQTVVRAYANPVAWTRAIFNATTLIHKQPRLPRAGSTLSAAFVSHVAIRENRESALIALMNQLRLTANSRGISMLVLGFASNDPRLAAVRRGFHCREYHSRLYVVRWPNIGGCSRDLDNRILGPEVALL
jgi:hypothetical protein